MAAEEVNQQPTDWQIKYATLPGFEGGQAWEATGRSDFREAELEDGQELTFWAASSEHDDERLRDLDDALQRSDRHPGGGMPRAFAFYSAVLAGRDYIRAIEDLNPRPEDFLDRLKENQVELEGIASAGYAEVVNELDALARGATYWVLLGRGRGAELGDGLRRGRAAQLRGMKLCFDNSIHEPVGHPVLRGKDSQLSVWHDTARLFIGPTYEA